MAELIDILIVEPIEIELDDVPVIYIGTAQAGPRGEQGPPGGTMGINWGAKKTGVDAGTLKEMSFDDDYGYVCVVEGDAGVAIWKRFLLFQT